MANRLKMAIISSIQTLHDQGVSARQIARMLGIHRETVGRYIKQAVEVPGAAKPATNLPSGSEVAGCSKPANLPAG